MKKYPAWQAPFLCWFSGDFYKDVAVNWRGIAFGYLFLITLSVWLFIGARWYALMASAFTSARPIVEQFPVMKLRDGELSIDKPSPLKITATDGKTVLVVFDTSGGEKVYPGVPFIFTKHKLIAQNMRKDDDSGNSDYGSGSSSASASSLPFNVMSDGRLDQDQLQSFVDMVPALVIGGLSILMVPTIFLTTAVQVLILGAVAFLMASKLFGTQIKYGQGMRVGVIASTPGMIFLAIAWTFVQIPKELFIVLWIGLALGYTFFGIRSSLPGLIALNTEAAAAATAETAAAVPSASAVATNAPVISSDQPAKPKGEVEAESNLETKTTVIAEPAKESTDTESGATD